MKHVFYLVFVCCLCSCNHAEKEHSFYSETNGYFRVVEEFSYKGHDYIKFTDGIYRCGVVHNPDCKKCKEHE